MFVNVLWWLLFGLIAGAIARLLVPGRHHLGLLATAVLGVLGSFVGGFLGYLLFHHDTSKGAMQPAGIFGSIIGAIVLLWLMRKISRRSYSGRRY